MIARDPWLAFARHTPARIALGRTGASLPTEEVLRFALAHAQARDAVHTPFDAEAVAAGIAALRFDTAQVSSAAPTRDVYLRRPDLGRRLCDASRAVLAEAARAPVDLALVVADGLSSSAVHAQAIPFLAALKGWIEREKWSVAPVVVAGQARVALGDEAGDLLKARAVAVLIGERPGLSSPDSLGVYLTFGPRPGLSDAERNCISNIRGEGLPHAAAAFKLAWLLKEAFRRNLTGIDLKDDSDSVLEGGLPPAYLK
ncbi:ethanolamine ammonia-lyase subunit EutC [Aquabacter sp. CN5-332]|uniref:ethanolamine ammonia-lyase subunit EutC n=1 Tax=Aquabacter sp. CN5-332 TaxID=3156608 RepID=UPI0032B4B23D